MGTDVLRFSVKSPTRRYRANRNVRVAQDDDGMIILDLRTGQYSAVNPTGAFIWSRIGEGLPQPEIVNALQMAFPDLPSGRITADVANIVEAFEYSGLIVVSEERASPASATQSSPIQSRVGRSNAASPAFRAKPDVERNHPEPEQSRERVVEFANEGSWRPLGIVDFFWRAMALLALAVVDFLMHVFPFPYLYRGVQKVPVASPHAESLRALRRTCRSIEWAAAAYFKPVRCLQRSAVCTCLLRWRGIPAELVFGVRTFPFEAHAWAELDGCVIDDNPTYVRRFLVLDRI